MDKNSGSMHKMKRKYVSTEHYDHNGKKVTEKYFSNKMETKGRRGNHVKIFYFKFI